MVKLFSRILAYNWRHYALAVLVFVVFWQGFSALSAVRVADDKLQTAMRQNAAYFEKAFLDGDVFETQRIMWRVKNDNIKRITFHPVEFAGSKWIFKEAIVGNLYDRPRAQITHSVPFVSNGATLGTLEYVIDLVDVNAAVFEANYVLFITVVFFFLGLLIVSNLGAIRTLLAVERAVHGINAVAESGRGEDIRGAINEHIGKLPADIIGAPFAEMTGRMSDALGKAARLESELAVSKAVSDMAAQVAHDIRSPLAALDGALKDLSALPAEQQALARGAMGRIGEIANDLLENYRKPGAKAAAAIEPQDLATLIAPVLAEKRAQYAARPEIKIDFTSAAARAGVQPAELRRIVSNLVNNAVEAFEKGGRVAVELARLDGHVHLKITDDGKGIPPEVLAKLGQKGGTHGKAGGTGLGLYHARTAVESWGGTFRIDSKPGAGTAVTIELPAVEAEAAPKTAVLLDDDALVRMTWKAAARAKGVDLKAYATPAELVTAAISKDTPVYIDSELGEGVKGEEIAKELRAKGYTNIRLETGHPPEKFAHLPWLQVTGKEPPWA
jgi:signal transduction histidine kinase